MTAPRSERTREADARLRALLDGAAPESTGVALVAVGGYGRRELSPHSDLDVMLLHSDERADVDVVAERVWYPLWDDGVRLDHSVRSLTDVEKAAAADVRTALALLDSRHVAGDPNLTLQMRSMLLTAWRTSARHRLPLLHQDCRARAELAGDLAYAAVPDLKESRGGLRDGVVLRALVASWLVDVPHAELERCRTGLLEVRDALHLATGRAADRLLPEVMPELAARLGEPDTAALHRRVRALGRRMAHLSTLTWRRLDSVLETARPVRGVRQPALHALGHGVARSGGEVVLDGPTRSRRDRVLMLRAAATASEHGLMLSPSTATRLAREGRPLPTPWSREVRDLMVRLLGSGPALVPVWETLEEVGAVGTLLPEWGGIHLLASSSPVHRYTVDRHSVETCVQAAPLLHRVARPDLLLVAALLHDIGKGASGDHSRVGAPQARDIAVRWGFPAVDADLVGALVRHHLLLPHTATRRDLEDPATLGMVAERVNTPQVLDMLAVLTEADARATGPAAWSRWRGRLVQDLVARTRECLADRPAPGAEQSWPEREVGRAWVGAERTADGEVLTVGAPDRPAMLASVAAALALGGLRVRSARAAVRGGTSWSRWVVDDPDPADPAAVRQRLLAVLDGGLDPRDRLRAPGDRTRLRVTARSGDSEQATVVEVRDSDWRGLVYAVCSALADAGVEVRSAHVETLGPRAVDVFYLREPDGGALSERRTTAVVRAIDSALGPGRHG